MSRSDIVVGQHWATDIYFSWVEEVGGGVVVLGGVSPGGCGDATVTAIRSNKFGYEQLLGQKHKRGATAKQIKKSVKTNRDRDQKGLPRSLVLQVMQTKQSTWKTWSMAVQPVPSPTTFSPQLAQRPGERKRRGG
ncbi:hypothetical protein EYF80_015581 [Liparis tanakae]|uniref:Uncharacterized protein n=1 Tax=Liparis tanakae TaxID=230148 RepID=A0A4Z2I7W1_9TELE|nr:hypothetical protein EYF80_015581 [Liparis tanakae]